MKLVIQRMGSQVFHLFFNFNCLYLHLALLRKKFFMPFTRFMVKLRSVVEKISSSSLLWLSYFNDEPGLALIELGGANSYPSAGVVWENDHTSFFAVHAGSGKRHHICPYRRLGRRYFSNQRGACTMPPPSMRGMAALSGKFLWDEDGNIVMNTAESILTAMAACTYRNKLLSDHDPK